MGLGTAMTNYNEHPYSQEKAALLKQDYIELPDIVRLCSNLYLVP